MSFGTRVPLQPVTVSVLNQYIKQLVSLDEGLQAVCVCGEISNFTAHRSGHMYFSLKDENSYIRAVMFRSDAERLHFRPENGVRVVIFGRVSVYVRDGQYQLYVSRMEPDGIGALAWQFQQLKTRLQAEGLFDQEKKKKLPTYPKKIGVITSPTGAAVRDIISILHRRYPIATILLHPAAVQGAEAPSSLTAALNTFARREDLDVIIIGRGGGSFEDLFAFNDEALVRAIAACPIPVVSAVGHETDFTLCDFVADLRAPTPSAAAELVVPDIAELLLRIDNQRERAMRAMCVKLDRAESDLKRLSSSRIYRAPETLYDEHRFRLMQLTERLAGNMAARQTRAEEFLRTHAARLQALSPLGVLARGYAAVKRNGAPEDAVCRASSLTAGDNVSLLFADGVASAQVLSVSLQKTKKKTVNRQKKGSSQYEKQ